MATARKNNARSAKTPKTKFIFWCHTDLPEDYVFIYSSSELGAQRKYRLEVNYIDFQHIIAKKICNIPASLFKELKIKKHCDIASDELLKKSGIEFLTKDEKVFRYKGKIFRESNVIERLLTKDRNQIPSIYLFKVKDRNCFKIGNSANIPRRLKETTGPDQLDLITYVQNPSAIRLEKDILKQFKKFSVGKEFVVLDSWGYNLLMATFNLYHLEYHKKKSPHSPSVFFKDTLEKLTQLAETHHNEIPPTETDKKNGNEVIQEIDRRIEEKDNAIWANWCNALMTKLTAGKTA